MSDILNDRILDYYFEQGLELGMNDEEAEKYARTQFTKHPQYDPTEPDSDTEYARFSDTMALDYFSSKAEAEDL